VNPFSPQAKLFYHGDRVKEWLETGKTRPILIEIDPTGFCNADCPWCFYRGKKVGKALDTEATLEALEGMAKAGIKAINWTGGGEPTLHPDLKRFVDKANSLGIKSGLFTNAIKEIDPSGFEWIRVSFTNKYYSVINPDTIRRYAKATKLGISMNIDESNRDSAYDLCSRAKELGADYFQIRPILERSYLKQKKIEPPYKLKELQSKDFKVYLSEYKFEDSTKPKDYKICYGGHFTPVLDYNGNVRNCNYHLDKDDHILGNIYDTPFEKIVMKDFKVLPDCQNCCKNHQINKLLNHLKEVSDVEFV